MAETRFIYEDIIEYIKKCDFDIAKQNIVKFFKNGKFFTDYMMFEVIKKSFEAKNKDFLEFVINYFEQFNVILSDIEIPYHDHLKFKIVIVIDKNDSDCENYFKPVGII